MFCQDQEIAEPLNPAALRARLAALSAGLTEPAVALGLSGGPDSMALCKLLSELYKEGQCPPVHAITVDHSLRPESAMEAIQVGGLVAGWAGINHAILTRVLPDNAGTRVMETARFDRYRLLEQYCASHAIHTLFVAHHRDDQAETLLFRLAKGSGLDGLAAMRPATMLPSGLRLCRPLLDISKAALIATCKAYDIPFIEDPSNRNETYARPRLRALMEGLAAEGLTMDRLAGTASRLARAREALEFYTNIAEAEAISKKETDRIVFVYSRLKSLPEDIRIRLLRRACMSIKRDDYGPRMGRLEDLAGKLFTAKDSTRMTLAGCLFTLNIKNDTLTAGAENT